MLLTQVEFRTSCLLFDMDGTLINSHAPVIRAYTDWAAHHGLDAAMVLRECQGRRVIDTVRALAPPGTDVEADTAALKQRELDDVDGIVEIPGALAMLASLPDDRWAVVTSAERPLAIRRMQAAGLPIPRFLFTSDDIARGKPAPDGFIAGAKALGAEPQQALVFEDSAAGIASGLAAASKVIALTSTLDVAQIDALGPSGYLHDFLGVKVFEDQGKLLFRIA
ncbi:HAD-IA family hydrolase [Burkholderia sp. PAMC 28687]|uniref:HAD-IA family hydrolase n=1 Tax=Burkholderia sp. PAMC 28687 TaxID=1795874 RepID=UPI0009E834E1|nr:HAD-IA family hydrolase [Burkholderia sp. PAMC 28687]